jgi:hypothetical protein
MIWQYYLNKCLSRNNKLEISNVIFESSVDTATDMLIFMPLRDFVGTLTSTTRVPSKRFGGMSCVASGGGPSGSGMFSGCS